MAYCHIHPPALRGAARVLRPPCPRAEARNEGDDVDNDPPDRILTFPTIANNH